MNKSSIFREVSKRHIRTSTNVPVGLLFLLTVLGLVFILFVVALIRHLRVRSTSPIAGLPPVQGSHCGPYVIPLDSPPSYEDIFKETGMSKFFQPLPPSYEQSLNLPKPIMREQS